MKGRRDMLDSLVEDKGRGAGEVKGAPLRIVDDADYGCCED